MKKTLLCLTLAIVFACKSFAYDFYSDGICYNIMGNGQVEVTSGYNYSGSVVIPSSVTYDLTTYSVTSIGDSAFFNLYAQYGYVGYGITSITIPNSVTSIGNSAFHSCSGLTSINIPNGVTSIGDYAFSCCSGLTSISVDANNTIYDSRNNCNAIIETATNKLICGCQTTVIPNGVTSIGDLAFLDCSGLTSINIPNSVTSIEDYAFAYCSGLTSITIPNSVTSIGYGAFVFCSGLTEIICHAVTPPTIELNTFSTYDNIILYVPANSITAYSIAAYWRNFFIQPIQGTKFTITVNTNDNTMGTVVGGGTYEENSIAQLIAVPKSGYVFQRWNDGNTNNPRNVIVTQDSTFTAYFALLDNEHYTLEDQGVYYINGRIYNSQNMEIKLYYSDGRLISSSANDIEMSSYPSGIYVVTDGKGGFLKINHYK